MIPEFDDSYYGKLFKFSHLPKHLQDISRPFYELAESMYDDLPDNKEKEVMFRKLLEAKDCAVRTKLVG